VRDLAVALAVTAANLIDTAECCGRLSTCKPSSRCSAVSDVAGQQLPCLRAAHVKTKGMSRRLTACARGRLRAKPVRTASGIAVVAVMSKPHRCPHIATTGNICVYCPGGPDSDFEYSTQVPRRRSGRGRDAH